MKNLMLLFILIGAIVFNTNQLLAQKTDGITTESFTVSGNCESCKARIEKAAKSAGAEKAVWNVDTKVLAVSYNKDKVTIDDIHKSIAKAGHDTDKVKATDKKYKTLPACCQYDRTADDKPKAPVEK